MEPANPELVTPVETPVVPESAPVTSATTPVESATEVKETVVTKTTVTPTRDYEAELAIKDAEIKRIGDDALALRNSQHATQGDFQSAQQALAKAVLERETLVANKDAIIAETTEKLTTASQATQTLENERTTLSADLESMAAKATKLEVLTEEFPDLLRYSKLLPSSRDPEVVREACKQLQAARGADLEAHRINAVTGNGMSQLPTQPIRTEMSLTNPDQMKSYLEDAMSDPKEYERRRQVLVDQFNAAVQRGAS